MVFSTKFTSRNISYNPANKLSLIEKLSIHLFKQIGFCLFIVLVLVAMTTDFENKLKCADEFYKPLKFLANAL